MSYSFRSAGVNQQQGYLHLLNVLLHRVGKARLKVHLTVRQKYVCNREITFSV